MTNIYVLKDPRDGCVRYVGKTVDLHRRYITHMSLKYHKGTHLMSWLISLKRLGIKPVMEVIELVGDTEWAEREKFWISEYRKMGCDLVNLTDGGEGCDGYRHTEETKLKMIEMRPSFKGEKNPMFGKIGEKNPNLGRHHTEESKKKMSAKQSGVLNPMFGKKLPDTTKEKLSKVQGKAVRINGIEYPSIRQAAKAFSVSHSTIRYRIKFGNPKYKVKSWNNFSVL